jgi:GntR family transcriptional regulator, transcriptional repressor for pyruvate dehydrogenase complex
MPKAKEKTKSKLKVAAVASPQSMHEPVTVSNILARRLHDAISRKEFVVGSSLLSERDLMAKYQVSRATVREALRVLCAQDLIHVKRGRSGGYFISSPTSDSVVRSLNQFIRGQDFRFIDLVSARHAIEPAAASQAALSRTERQLEALKRECQECERSLEDMDRFVAANLKWHLVLAEASNNPLFVAFLTSISTAMHEATAFEEFDIRARMATIGVHWQIYKAIQDRDPDAAHRRTVRHLTAYRDKLATIIKDD